ncbi:MAG: hypothetical protein WAT61_04145 [Flavobacteriales bacterium]|jgi:hypothetical protein|nr:hypothetical protein [Flavobacteriales bacterium]
MTIRVFLLAAVLVPVWAFAQETGPPPSTAGGPDPVNPVILSKNQPVKPFPSDAPNALTMQVIMAQKPAGITEDQWRKMMLEPVNATLYPIRITQAMLDTLDATQLDLRYRYVMVPEQRTE